MTKRIGWIIALGFCLATSPARAQVATDDLPQGESIASSNASAHGAWTRLVPGTINPVVSPGARMLHSAIYDPDGDRLVVYGGLYFSLAYSQVMTASLSTGEWTVLDPTGPAPDARRDHVAIYDSQRHRMVVYGGSPAYDSFDADTWQLTLGANPAWTQLATAGQPQGRFAHAAIYDPVRDRMVVFGGYTNDGFTNEVFALDFAHGNQWANVSAAGTGPTARDAMTAVYDPVRDRMLVFGGWTGSVFDNRVWALSLAGTPTWLQVGTVGIPPSARRHYGASYDAAADRLIVWGGFDSSLNYRNDAWALMLAGTPTWSQLTPAGAAPSPRNGQRAIFDPVRDRLVTFAGYDGSYDDDLWALSLGATPAWEKLGATPTEVGGSPGGIRDHVAAYDAQRGRMLVFGGSGYFDSFSNTTYALTLGATPSWSRLVPGGTPPPGRFSHAGAYDSARDRLLVFGGYSLNGFRNDVWALALAGTPAWTQLAPTGTPPAARDAMTTVYDAAHDRLLLVGGWTGAVYKNDVWELTFAGGPAWHEIVPSGTPPSPRRHYAAAWDPAGNRLVLTGGFGAAGFLADTWTLEFDAQGNAAWIEQHPRGPAPSARNGHRAALDAANDRVLVFGGYDNAYRNDFWALDLTGRMKWDNLRTGPHAEEPDPSLLGTLIADPVHSRFIQLGGVDIREAKRDVWAFAFGTGNASAPLAPAAAATPGRDSPLSIRRVSPNPSSGPIDVAFSLPGRTPAELSLYTITGRRVARRSVGDLGAGEHVVSLTRGRDLSPGIYLVRLSNGANVRNSKVVVAPGP
jgi:hypothetical protein